MTPDHVPPGLQPVVGARDAWLPMAATWACDRCGAVASTVTLLPPFAPDPQAVRAEAAGGPRGLSRLGLDSVRLSVEGPVSATHTLLGELGTGTAALEAAIRAGDAPALYALDREYAPAWCRLCEKSYCRSCWTIWVEYDDGHYDATRGRCPEGHERTLDD